MRTWQFRPRTVPFALLLYCILSFGLLIPWLGFYWDDWPTVYTLHVLGPGGFIDAFSGDRPSLGWLFMVTTAILGKSTLAWQIFGLLTRWLACLALLWALRLIWPNATRQVTWTAFLFAAYPGFLQQYIALTYSHSWIVLAAFFASLGSMLLSLRDPQRFWLWSVVSWLLAAFSVFTNEYFFGLELLRPVFLWLVERETPRRAWIQAGRVARRWLPYLIILAVFLFWRLIIHESPRGDVQIFDKMSQSPVDATLEFGQEALLDAFESSFIAWGQVLNIPRQITGGLGPLAIYTATVITIALLSGIYLTRFADPTHLLIPTQRWSQQAILIGGLALLVGGIPFWVTNLPIELRFPWDRFNLAMNLGASLLLTGLLEFVARTRRLNTLILTCLLALAAGTHMQLANAYRREWNTQKSFFWQLVWRAPNIQPGTIILSAELPFTYYSDNSLTAPLNWTYAPDLADKKLPYLFFNIESRLGGSLEGIRPGLEIVENYRALDYKGTTSQAIAIFYNPPGCVKFVDPQTDAKTPQKPLYFTQVLSLSNLTLILPEPGIQNMPPSQYFGREPERGWCYYFEKADLARQQGDWDEVSRLGDTAFALNTRLYEINATELLPYIEGYASTGMWKRAEELTMEAMQLTFRMQRILCTTWDRISSESGDLSSGRKTIDDVQLKLECNP